MHLTFVIKIGAAELHIRQDGPERVQFELIAPGQPPASAVVEQEELRRMCAVLAGWGGHAQAKV